MSQRLPKTTNAVGCGSGAFTVGAALRGYGCIGLDYVESNIRKATERARLCKALQNHFEVFDICLLDQRADLRSAFDIVICCEVIEHIFNDTKLMQDLAACLKPGGRLLLTTPNFHYRPITRGDNGPWPQGGGHVQKVYNEEDLVEMCHRAGLVCDGIIFCTRFLSQKITWIYRVVGRIPLLGWAVILPLRIIPPIFDALVTKWLSYPYYSICIKAHKADNTNRKSL